MPNGFQFLLKEVVDEFRMTNGRYPVGGMGNREVKAEADRRWEVKKNFITQQRSNLVGFGFSSQRVRVKVLADSGSVPKGFGFDSQRVRVRFRTGSGSISNGFGLKFQRVAQKF